MAATLLGANGRPLRSSRPANLASQVNMGLGFEPMWNEFMPDSERGWHSGPLKSFEALYRSQPLLAGVIDKLTRRIASLPFLAYTVLADDERRPVPRSDSLATLIRKPMRRQSTVHLLSHIAQGLLVHGNALVVIGNLDRDKDLPDVLIPLDWAQVSAYAHEGSPIEAWSTTQFGGDVGEVFIKADSVLHFAWPGPDGSEIGVSPLEKAGITIRSEDAAQRLQLASFKNGARPSMVISMEGTVKDEDRKRYRAMLEQLHSGVDNNSRTLLLGNGARAQPFSMSPVEVSLIEQRKLNREEIGMVFDLSGPLMNDLSHGTMANVEEMLKSLYRDVLPPWLELICQTFQVQLFDERPEWLNREVVFDLSDKLRGTPAELAAVTKILVESGVETRNEARRVWDLPPVDEEAADVLSANVNNQAQLSAMKDGSEPAPAPPQLPPGATQAPEEVPQTAPPA